jgi:hypothetical protein
VERAQLAPDVDLPGIQLRPGSQRAGQLQPAGREVDRDDVLAAAVAEARDGGEADGAGSEHGGLLVGQDLELVDGVHAHAQRFGEGGQLEGHRVGQPVEAPPVGAPDEQSGRESAFGTAIADRASCGIARIERHPVSHGQRLDARPDLFDDA